MLEDSDARELYGKLAARGALPDGPPRSPAKAAPAKAAASPTKRDTPVSPVPPFDPAEAAKLAALAGADARRATWIEKSASGLAKLACRGDGGSAFDAALAKAGLTAKRHRALLRTYFRGGRKFDPKLFEERDDEGPSKLKGALTKAVSEQPGAPIPWSKAPLPVAPGDVRGAARRLLGRATRVATLPAADNAEPPFELLGTFQRVQSGSLATADPASALGATICKAGAVVVVANLQRSGGKHALCVLTGSDEIRGCCTAIADAARRDARALEGATARSRRRHSFDESRRRRGRDADSPR